MKKQFKIYLAGPDVFRTKEQVKEVTAFLKETCKKYGYTGNFPLDTELVPEDGNYGSQQFSFLIFRNNIRLIEESDVVIANLENFRGPNTDDGTAFELGYGFALKKILYGYSPTAQKSYTRHYKTFSENVSPSYKTEMEKAFPEVENFEGNTANLMLVGAIHDAGGKIFNTFEECVKDLAERFA